MAEAARSTSLDFRARLNACLENSWSPLVVLCVWLVGLGWFFRLHDFGFPRTFLFDEHHFVENARHYLRSATDENDHPPLGKLCIALSISALGDNPVGWRFPSLIFGALSVGVAAVAAKRLFRSSLAGLLAATFLSIDGFLISYSRAALLDGMLALSALLSLLAASLPPFSLAVVGGLAAGLGMATKFSGVAALLPPLIALWLQPALGAKRSAYVALCVGLALMIYAASYLTGFVFMGKPPSLSLVISETQRLLAHHSVLTDMKNPATSSWPTWLLPVRPLLLAHVVQGGWLRSLSSLGNLALWWSACGVGLALSARFVWRGVGTALATPQPSAPSAPRTLLEQVDGFAFSHARSARLLLAGVLAFLAPWVLTHRDSYYYHFLPSYSLLLVLLAGFVASVSVSQRRHALLFLVLVALVAGIYGPLWSFMPLSEAGFRARLFLGSWR